MPCPAHAANSLNELTQEPHISGVKLSDFADAVLHHGYALDTHAEGKSRDLFGIVGRLFLCGEGENRGIDHAAAQQFDPAGILALSAAFAATKDTADLDVGARFGEGKEGREEARFYGGPEQRLHGVVESTLQIAEGDVGADAEAFDLAEDGRVGCVQGIVAMQFAGDHDADRGRL
jgi:hypothetical protein